MDENFEKHREFLVDRIDPDFGLLDKLRASGTLTREALHKIKLKDNTTEDKNRILLDFVLQNKKVDELISALTDCGQTHLVNYLNADGGYRQTYGDDWPLSESDISQLDNNCESFVDLLDTSDLCIRLFSEKVINDRQKQLILSKPTNADKNDALLEILQKCSIRQYNTTITCLSDSNQGHIAELLSKGGVFVRVHAHIENTVGNIDRLEDEIITKVTRDLENYPLDEATRLLEVIHERLRIVAARKGQSIVLYIHCTTNDDLLQLTDLLTKDILKGIIEKIFTDLLSMGDALRVTLTWSVEELKRASTHFECVRKRVGEKKHVVSDAKVALANPQGTEDSMTAEVEEATIGFRIRCSVGTQTDLQHDDKNSCRPTSEKNGGRVKCVGICDNKECMDLKEKFEQTLKEKDRLAKLLEEQRSRKEEYLAVNEDLEQQEQSENTNQMKQPIYQRQEEYEKLEQEQSQNTNETKQPIDQSREVELQSECYMDSVLTQIVRTKAKEREKIFIRKSTIPDREFHGLTENVSKFKIFDLSKIKHISGLNSNKFHGLSSIENLSKLNTYDLSNIKHISGLNSNKSIHPADKVSSNKSKCFDIWENESLIQLSSDIWTVDPTENI